MKNYQNTNLAQSSASGYTTDNKSVQNSILFTPAMQMNMCCCCCCC